ncbi:glucan endo-1,3-alpha-glucosidase, partial [Tremellales sp. Uapishka_1]
MAGFVGEYNQALWLNDITLAHSKGIDGFALNCDGSDVVTAQLPHAFAAAESYNAALPSGSTPFQLFISPDFVHYSTSDPSAIVDLLRPYLSSSAYFIYENKPFTSSFEGYGTDWSGIGTSLGKELYAVPYYEAASQASDAGVDGVFSWHAWPGQDSSSVVYENLTTQYDQAYIDALKPLNKTYMAPVGPVLLHVLTRRLILAFLQISPWCKLHSWITRPFSSFHFRLFPSRRTVELLNLPCCPLYCRNVLVKLPLLFSLLSLATPPLLRPGHTPADPSFPGPVYAHLPASTGYPKNYYLYSDVLFPTRWAELVKLAYANPTTLPFIEIITWNDWTESSNIGPYMGGVDSSGTYLWAQNMSHVGMMEIMPPFIRAFKAGEQVATVAAGEEKMVWWYRPSLNAAECDSTDTCGTKPTGAYVGRPLSVGIVQAHPPDTSPGPQVPVFVRLLLSLFPLRFAVEMKSLTPVQMAADSIFVCAMTTSDATVTVTSGSSTTSQTVSAGITTLAFPMKVGKQSFAIKTASGTGSGVGTIEITAGCYNGVYNFNIVSGSIDVVESGNNGAASTGVSSSSTKAGSGSSSSHTATTSSTKAASSTKTASSGVTSSSSHTTTASSTKSPVKSSSSSSSSHAAAASSTSSPLKSGSSSSASHSSSVAPSASLAKAYVATASASASSTGQSGQCRAQRRRDGRGRPLK